MSDFGTEALIAAACNTTIALEAARADEARPCDTKPDLPISTLADASDIICGLTAQLTNLLQKVTQIEGCGRCHDHDCTAWIYSDQALRELSEAVALTGRRLEEVAEDIASLASDGKHLSTPNWEWERQIAG